MAFVTRYRVENEFGEVWDGREFTRVFDDHARFIYEAEADEVVAEHGGWVEQFGCSCRTGIQGVPSTTHLQAAE